MNIQTEITNDFTDINIDYKDRQKAIDIKTNRLLLLKKNLENMDISNHIEILYIFIRDKNIKYSENSNGTFINLTELNDNMIDKLENFIEYINKQNTSINDIELKKKNLENIFFKQNKD